MNRFFQKHGIYTLLCVGLLVMAGCAKEPEPVEEEAPAPPPPTPQEIAAKIINDTKLEGPLPAQGANFPKPQQQKLLSAIQMAKTSNSATTDGQTALRIVSRAIERRISQFQNAQLWNFVLPHIDAYLVLNPGSSRYDSVKRRATLEMTKPRPTIRGFMQDGRTGDSIVMLEIFLPSTQETKKEQMRVGDELYGLRLESIIGANKGIVMDYVETGDTFEIMYSKD
jgi:hypothetical protein